MVSLSNHAQQHCHRTNQQLLKRPIKNNRGCLSTPPNLGYSIPVLSMGSCFRSRSKVGKDGVSAGGQRTQALADLFVFGGQSAHFRQILPPLLTPTPIVRTLHRRRRWARTPGVHPLAPRNKQKLAGRGTTLAGGLRIALPYLPRRASTTARLPTMQTMARRKSGRGKGETWPLRSSLHTDEEMIIDRT